MGPPFDPAYIFREEQVASYERIRTAAKKLATDPTMGFIVVHWNVPHPQGIYDRTNNRFETRNKSNYFDNLELMDAAISELRTAMTAAGVWDTTTIILTSDHPLRPKLWGARTKQWSLEEETLTQKRRRSAIPFIIKLAGHNEGITYEGSYDVFHTRELISAGTSRRGLVPFWCCFVVGKTFSNDPHGRRASAVRGPIPLHYRGTSLPVLT